MSKRYGRNQRRRAREEIKRLEAANTMNEGLVAHLGKELRSLDRQVCEAKDMVAMHSALFPPEGEVKASHEGSIRLHVPRVLSLEEAAKLTDPRQKEHQRLVDLNVVIGSVTGNALDLSRHCRVRINGAEVLAYGITRQALHTMPTERLIRIVSEELARMFAAKWEGLVP